MFAPELTDQIIDYLGFDAMSLKVCTLVSRVWASRARYYLHRKLSLDIGRQWDFFALLLASDSLLKGVIPLRNLVHDFVLFANRPVEVVTDDVVEPLEDQ